MSRPQLFVILVCLPLFALDAHAAIDDTMVFDTVLAKYQSAASTWGAVISARATWLFWVLATISMVWTFGMMALRKADIGEFFAEFIRFTVTTGFFWWLLSNGPAFAKSIMSGLCQMAANASGNPATLTPSGIVDIGFQIFFNVLDESSIWSPVDSASGIIISGVILVVLALVGVNMLILLVAGWILAYAGIFFLGFGGSRWTSDMAIGYFKNVLGIAAQLMTMVLLVGIGKSFVDQYYTAMSTSISLKELGVMLVVAVVLLALVHKVPPMIGAIAGGHIQTLGGGFGAEAALGAAAAGGAALSMAGAALAAGAANIGGGAQALMAAFSKANASESGGGSPGTGDLMSAIGGAADGVSVSGDGSPLALAMGDTGGVPPAMTMADTSSFSGGGFGLTDDGEPTGPGGVLDGDGTTGGEAAKPQDGTHTDTSGGGTKSGGSHAAAAAAKAGRVAAGTVGNLARGVWDVAKEKVLDSISDTAGGKVAAAIKARAGAEDSKFDGNSLSAGNDKADAESEVAAFRDKKP
jgi:type IV secretion system protein TrbL